MEQRDKPDNILPLWAPERLREADELSGISPDRQIPDDLEGAEDVTDTSTEYNPADQESLDPPEETCDPLPARLGALADSKVLELPVLSSEPVSDAAASGQPAHQVPAEQTAEAPEQRTDSVDAPLDLSEPPKRRWAPGQLPEAIMQVVSVYEAAGLDPAAKLTAKQREVLAQYRAHAEGVETLDDSGTPVAVKPPEDLSLGGGRLIRSMLRRAPPDLFTPDNTPQPRGAITRDRDAEPETAGQLIDQLRRERTTLTQKQLGELIDNSESKVLRVLKGYSRPPIADVQAMLDHIPVSDEERMQILDQYKEEYEEHVVAPIREARRRRQAEEAILPAPGQGAATTTQWKPGQVRAVVQELAEKLDERLPEFRERLSPHDRKILARYLDPEVQNYAQAAAELGLRSAETFRRAGSVLIGRLVALGQAERVLRPTDVPEPGATRRWTQHQDPASHVGIAINQQRAGSMTVTELAARWDISPSAATRFLTGQAYPPLTRVEAYLRQLDLPESEVAARLDEYREQHRRFFSRENRQPR